MTGRRRPWGNARTVVGRPASGPTNPASSRPPGETWPGKNASGTAPAVGGLFLPQSQSLGIDRTSFSPRVQQKIVHAGVNGVSYQQASRDLAELSDLTVAPKSVERLTKRIGRERIDQRDADVTAHKRLPLMAKDHVA